MTTTTNRAADAASSASCQHCGDAVPTLTRAFQPWPYSDRCHDCSYLLNQIRLGRSPERHQMQLQQRREAKQRLARLVAAAGAAGGAL